MRSEIEAASGLRIPTRAEVRVANKSSHSDSPDSALKVDAKFFSLSLSLCTYNFQQRGRTRCSAEALFSLKTFVIAAQLAVPP